MPAVKNKKKKKAKANNEVIVLKFIVLFVILLIPSVVVVLSMNKQALVLKYKEIKNLNKTADLNINKAKEQDFHFEAPIPTERSGNMANVSQDKIDSLFDNLK